MIITRIRRMRNHHRRDPRCTLAVHAGTVDAAGSSHATTAVPQTDTCTVDAGRHGAHYPRGPGAANRSAPRRRSSSRGRHHQGPEPTLAERRAATDKSRIARAEEARKLYPVDIKEETMGGVRCDVIKPLNIPAAKRDRVLINVHGGGFNSDSGSLVEGIPIAYLTATTVVSVYYRLAPEYPFPAAVDDTVAVFRELLKTYKPAKIGLFGTSAGAILTAEVAVRLRRDGLPLPGVLGIFSGTGDMSRAGDSQALYTVRGFGGKLRPPSKTPLLLPTSAPPIPRTRCCRRSMPI